MSIYDDVLDLPIRTSPYVPEDTNLFVDPNKFVARCAECGGIFDVNTPLCDHLNPPQWINVAPPLKTITL